MAKRKRRRQGKKKENRKNEENDGRVEETERLNLDTSARKKPRSFRSGIKGKGPGKPSWIKDLRATWIQLRASKSKVRLLYYVSNGRSGEFREAQWNL